METSTCCQLAANCFPAPPAAPYAVTDLLHIEMHDDRHDPDAPRRSKTQETPLLAGVSVSVAAFLEEAGLHRATGGAIITLHHFCFLFCKTNFGRY